MMFLLLCLTSLNMTLCICPCCCKWHHFMLFDGRVLFHCIHVPRLFMHSFVDGCLGCVRVLASPSAETLGACAPSSVPRLKRTSWHRAAVSRSLFWLSALCCCVSLLGLLEQRTASWVTSDQGSMLSVSEAGSPRSRCQWGLFLLRPL